MKLEKKELSAKPVAVHFCHEVPIQRDAGCVRTYGIDETVRANLRSFYKIFVVGRSLVRVTQFLNISHIFSFMLLLNPSYMDEIFSKKAIVLLAEICKCARIARGAWNDEKF